MQPRWAKRFFRTERCWNSMILPSNAMLPGRGGSVFTAMRRAIVRLWRLSRLQDSLVYSQRRRGKNPSVVQLMIGRDGSFCCPRRVLPVEQLKMVARFMASIGCLVGDYRSAFDVIQSSRGYTRLGLVLKLKAWHTKFLERLSLLRPTERQPCRGMISVRCPSCVPVLERLWPKWSL